jgi:hypothetical protein
MRLRFVRVGALAVAIAVALLASVTLAGQAPAPATNGSSQFRTAWGHPDLQGVWASNSATPLERPKALEGKKVLTDAELVALEQAARELFDGDTDAAFGDSVFEAALSKATQFKSNDGGTGNYNHFWLVERNFDNRTSLIIDPPDGRLPPMTDEARKRQAAASEYRKLHPADGPEDRGLGERCIGAGVPMTGRGYNSNYQILQTPTHVAIYLEMMHDARIIPLDPWISGRFARPVGRQHARGRDHELHAEERPGLPGQQRHDAFDGEVPPHRREDAGIRIHGQRSVDLHPALHGDDSYDAGARQRQDL